MPISLRHSAPSFRISTRVATDLLLFVEFLLVVAGAAAAKLVYVTAFLDSSQILQPYLIAGIAGGLLTAYMLRNQGLSEPSAVLQGASTWVKTVIAIGGAFLLLIAIGFLLKISADYSRGWLLTWFAIVCATVPLYRAGAARALQWLAVTGHTERRIAIVATEEAGRRLAEQFMDMPGVRLAGVFDARAQAALADLIAMGQRNEVDEVIVAVSHVEGAELASLMEALGVLPADVWLCPPEIAFDMRIRSIGRLGTVSLLQVTPKPINDWGYIAKAALDYSVGALALVLSAPVMLAIAAAIKLEGPGPVFFRQRRHGYNERVIDVFKFRTMSVTENGDTIVQARAGDPRVTRVGRFLRSTSLDELPQLFNVLRGEMSLVGPRPHALAHNFYYREKLQRYANRHRVKPGITGWAQINGMRGPTETPEKMRKRVELDLFYIENWSIWLDLKILALTPLRGFIHKNAL